MLRCGRGVFCGEGRAGALLQVGERVGRGVLSQQRVLHLESCVASGKPVNTRLETVHFFANRKHQVTLHQLLQPEISNYTSDHVCTAAG